MKPSGETQKTRIGAELLGVRWVAKRHVAFVRAGRVECSRRFVRAKAVSPLRSATAVQDALGAKLGLLVNFGHYPKVEYERVAL